jgi:hypothetical protein
VNSVSLLADLENQPDDANHNLVGFLDVLSDGTTVRTQNLFINVLDENIPASTILTIGPNVQRSNHVVNIWKPDLDVEHGIQAHAAQTLTITQQFYKNFADDFDFINLVFALPSLPQNRSHAPIQNNVKELVYHWSTMRRIMGVMVGFKE